MTYFCYDLNEYINTKKPNVEKIYIILKNALIFLKVFIQMILFIEILNLKIL